MKPVVICLLAVWSAEIFAVDWLIVRDPSTTVWRSVADSEAISFAGPELKFQYKIARDRTADRKPGAILVRVVRQYDPEWGQRSNLRSKTNLTRNEFPNVGELEDDEVYRVLYEKYHLNEVGNPKLRNKFHATIPPNVRTNAPIQRLSSFLFNDNYHGQTTQRAYLLYYKGISPEGTKIPFYVGITDAFMRLSVTVLELDPPAGVGILPRRVELVRK